MEKIIFVLFFAVVLVAGDDSQAIRDLCRFKIGNFPHPNPILCYQYVECQFLNGVVRECPEIDEIFVTGEGCVLGDRASCERFIPAPTVPTFPTDPTPPITEVCQETGVQTFPNPGNCSTFILCVNGVGDIVLCPSTRPVFDPISSFCVEGNPQTCEIFGNTPLPPTIIIPTLPSSTTQSPTASPRPRDACRGNNFRFIPDSNSCYRYYFCFFGSPLPYECPYDRIFSQRLQGCVKGDQETCTRNRDINNETFNNGQVL